MNDTVELDRSVVDAIVRKLIEAAEAEDHRFSQIKSREAAANLALEMKLDGSMENFEKCFDEAVEYLESISTTTGDSGE